jgi:hypothetical protein
MLARNERFQRRSGSESIRTEEFGGSLGAQTGREAVSHYHDGLGVEEGETPEVE